MLQTSASFAALYIPECKQCKFCKSGKTNLCSIIRITQVSCCIVNRCAGGWDSTSITLVGPVGRPGANTGDPFPKWHTGCTTSILRFRAPSKVAVDSLDPRFKRLCNGTILCAGQGADARWHVPFHVQGAADRAFHGLQHLQ